MGQRKGFKHSEETRAKMRAAHTGNPHPFKSSGPYKPICPAHGPKTIKSKNGTLLCQQCQADIEQRDRLFWLAKQRAKEKGLPFTIERKAMPKIPRTCPVLGIPIFRTKGKVTQNSPSLDRIHPELGYVPSNIRVISFRANSLKQDATEKELQLILTDLISHRDS